MTKIWKNLEQLGFISNDTVQLFSSETRDNKSLDVWRDEVSEVIFIKDNYVGDQAYTESEYVKDTPVDERPRSFEDQRNLDRRLSAFKHYTWGKDICDFGCGAGLFIDAVINDCSSAIGVELQTRFLDSMKKRGVSCTNSLDEISDSSLDCIFSFHVLEHVFNPLDTLKKLRQLMSDGDYLFVAVPGINSVADGDYKNDLRRYFHIGHVTDFTANTLCNVAAQAGFRKLDSDEAVNGLFVADEVQCWTKSADDSVENILRIDATYKGKFPHL